MLSLVPAAFAAGTDVTTEESLRTAVASGGTVTLGANITLTSPLEINTAVVIDGTTAKYSITAPSGQNAINASASGVEVKNLKINVSGNGYGVNSTGSSLTVTNCEISAVKRGISFYPTNGTGAALTVTGTTIKNPNISNYDTSAQYGDYRAVATNNIKKGTVTISNSSLLGYGYSINALVANDSTGLRDGDGTVFNITNTTIKGWTALNMWSANTKFNFTNCTLVGVSTLSGGSNNYSTIQANDGMYGSKTDKSSTVTFVGGSITAVKLGSSGQTVLNVDAELQTKYVFEAFYNEEEEADEPVVVSYYGPENTADSAVYKVMMWNFYPMTTPEKSQLYLDTMVSAAEGSVFLVGGTVDEYTRAVSTFRDMNDINVDCGFAVNAEGGAQ